MRQGDRHEEEVELEDRVHHDEAERDDARPEDPLVHVQVRRVPVEPPGPDVVEDDRRDDPEQRRDRDRPEEVVEVERVERLEQVLPGEQVHGHATPVSRAHGAGRKVSTGRRRIDPTARRVEYATDRRVYSRQIVTAPVVEPQSPHGGPPRGGRPRDRLGSGGGPGACPALGGEPGRHLRPRARPPVARRRGVRHRRDARAPRRRRHRGRLRLRPDERPAARRRPGQDVPPGGLRRHPRPPRRPGPAGRARPSTASGSSTSSSSTSSRSRRRSAPAWSGSTRRSR